MYNQIFLGLGSNLGNREENLEKATESLKDILVIEKISSVYEADPVGAEDHPQYLNQVLEAQTELAPHDLLSSVKELEKRLGRKTEGDMKPRVIDIDILFYNQNGIKSEKLIIPHPLIHKRNFVLIPLGEIAPEFVHPSYNNTIAELLEACEDKSGVEKL